jgi:hypothetical protein
LLARTISGRLLAEITDLGRPGRLSIDGFPAEDEDIFSVLKGDNRLVTKLGLAHAELARPLRHVCSMIRELFWETGARRRNLMITAPSIFHGSLLQPRRAEIDRPGRP